jgi:hypothetical protein
MQLAIACSVVGPSLQQGGGPALQEGDQTSEENTTISVSTKS